MAIEFSVQPKSEDVLDCTVDVPETVIVDFNDDFKDPHNWSNPRRWSILLLLTSLSILTNLSTTMVAPALDIISAEFGMDPGFEGPLVMSTYVLMLALGPVLVAPLSELYGRVPVVQCGTLCYLVFNLLCGFSSGRAQLLAFRVLSGTGSGAAPVVVIGFISDCFRDDERGRALGVTNMAFILAAPLGAIVGGFTAQSATWRYTFYATSAAAGVLFLVGLLVYRESYAPVMLFRRREKLRKDCQGDRKFRTPYEHDCPTIAALYYKTFIRPVYFLATQPIVQLSALYAAFIYGTTYLIFSTFPALWERHYRQGRDVSSLHFIAAGIGYAVGTVSGILFADRTYRTLKARNSGVGKPEFRLPLLAVSSLCVPLSLFWYGWCAVYRVHWAVLDTAIVTLMCGCTLVFQCVTAYFIEAYTLHASSASASSFLLRGLCAFGFPLFGPTLYERLGYGWGNSLLGFLAVVIAVLVPILLWTFGERLRKASNYTYYSH